MLRLLRALGFAAVLAVLLVPLYRQATGANVRRHVQPAGRAASSPIQHVIVIVMENRTVDNLFAGYYGSWKGVDLANPAGKPKLTQISLRTKWSPDHDHRKAFTTEFDGGKQDGWQNEQFACPHHRCEPNPTALSYISTSEVAPYAAIAQNFAFADETFQAGEGPSFPAHQYLIAAQAGGLADSHGAQAGYAEAENPGDRGGRGQLEPLEDLGGNRGFGCIGKSKTMFVDMKSAYPGTENLKQQFCLDYPTIFDLLDAQLGTGHKNWHYDTSNYSIWNAPLSVQHLYKAYLQHSRNVIKGRNGKQLLADLKHNDLPALTYVMPCFQNSDHPDSVSADGPKWVGYITNAIGSSAYWNSTAVVILWDDWGGWYDHVKTGHPANNPYENPSDPYEWGFRVPLIVASPYVKKRGYVDHTQRSYSAVLRYIEDNFGLGSLAGDDAINDDLSTMFDYSNKPLPWVPVDVGTYQPKSC